MLNRESLISKIREVIMSRPKSNIRENELWVLIMIYYIDGFNYSEIGRKVCKDSVSARNIVLRVRGLLNKKTSELVEYLNRVNSKQRRFKKFSNALLLKLMGMSNKLVEDLYHIPSSNLNRELGKYKEFVIEYMGKEKLLLLEKELRNPQIALELRHFKNSIQSLIEGYPAPIKFPLSEVKKREMLYLYETTKDMDALKRALYIVNYLKEISNR